jgi:hypothetical protein
MNSFCLLKRALQWAFSHNQLEDESLGKKGKKAASQLLS